MNANKLKIAIIVHGRFHAFDLAREFLRLGHEAHLYTNYPKFVAERFGVDRKYVTSFLLHGISDRLLSAANHWFGLQYPEAWMHRFFGRWAAIYIAKEKWDVVLAWSGVCEESFRIFKNKSYLVCERGSSHIVFQKRILEEEALRARSCQIVIPSDWIVRREMREYQLADMIHVPSTFAKESFNREGFPESKLKMIPLGADLSQFRMTPEDLAHRQERILAGKPLRVLNVGTFCFRKGIIDTATVVDKLAGKGFEFRFVGPVLPEARRLVSQLEKKAEFVSKVAQKDLMDQYAWADVFILPTVEDGFPMVLAQAAASGVIILTTPNGAGHDLVNEGKTGWVLAVRSPESFVRKLEWCATHRKELAAMAAETGKISCQDWKQVSKELILCFRESLESTL